MTDVPADATRRRSPLVAAAGLTALVALAAGVLAAVRPWGDTGVTAGGALDDALPVGHVVWALLAAVLALVAAVVPVPRRARLLAAALVTAVGVSALVGVRAVTAAQSFPRDGGWFALVAAAGSVAAGVLLLAAAPGAARRGPLRWAARVVAVVVPVGLVATAGLVAPGWPDHVVDGLYPGTFSESPGPTTVTEVGWQEGAGKGGLQAVIGGRLVEASTDDRVDGECRLLVRAFDLGSGRPVWQTTRPLRCDGPTLAVLDGNNTVVRVVLRGPRGELTGAPTTFYLGTVDGRGVTPSTALDAVRWWTEGFGLVTDPDTVRGLDARTGVTTWSREIPRCDDGSRASLRVPDAPAPGRAVARTPYDTLGSVPGTQHVAGTGTDVVVALSCGASPLVWVVDVIGSPTDDHVVTLPVPAAGTGDVGAVTFLPWLDTVVAVVPTAVDGSRVTGATLVGVTLPSGSVAWIRPVGAPLTTTVSPVDGSIRVTADLGGSAAGADTTTTVLDVGTGAVRSSTPSAVPAASLTLTAASIDVTDRAATVTATAGGTRTITLPDCTPDTSAVAPAPLLAGPGGVAVRCTTPQGPLTLGLVP